jgi:hypothetical protein
MGRRLTATWNRAGLIGACAYLALAVFTHHKALERVRKFAEFQGVRSDSIAALPLPPSLWNWDGLIRAPRGVYELRMDLSQASGIPDSTNAAPGSDAGFTYQYFPDAPANRLIQQARQLPEVQKVLWFDRFPVTRFHQEGAESVVEILDLRFPAIRPDRPASFTYRVRFDAAGKVLYKARGMTCESIGSATLLGSRSDFQGRAKADLLRALDGLHPRDESPLVCARPSRCFPCALPEIPAAPDVRFAARARSLDLI